MKKPAKNKHNLSFILNKLLTLTENNILRLVSREARREREAFL